MSGFDFSICFSKCWKNVNSIDIYFSISLPTGDVIAKIVDYSLRVARVCIFFLDF